MNPEDVNLRFRPLAAWGDPVTPAGKRRGAHLFRASWQDTVELLKTECAHLSARGDVILETVGGEARKDGWIRANANVTHRGAVLTLETRHGPLRLATDVYEQEYAGGLTSWQANVRAIAKGMEALRAVDRYGITQRAEQYRGYLQIEAGPGGAIAMGGAPAKAAMTRDEAAAVLAELAEKVPGPGRVTAAELLRQHELRVRVVRALTRKLHPDQGGDRADWDRLNEATAVLR